MGIISQKLRDSARGQECTFRIPGICCRDTETTVLCHLPSEVKALATKSDDWNAAFGCFACHEAIDQRRVSTYAATYFSLIALQRTQKIWRDMGLIVIAGDNEKPRKPSSKTIARRPMTVQPTRGD